MTRRRALVTGASSGIGAATARLLAASGYRVALLARRRERLEAIRSELEGEGHLVLPCDLVDADAIESALSELDGAFGGLDLLVNNAGMGYRARVEELDPALLDQVFAANVRGLLLSCRGALPLLRRGELPVVVNVSSVVGRRGVPGQAAYCASKAAVTSIGESLRIEWAPDKISVCTLSPALTATGFFGSQPNPSGLPDPELGGAALPAEVAQHVLALDRSPQPELTLRRKWHWLGILSAAFPRLADRLLLRRIGGGWETPAR
jgi:NAD(P)-dependent dehydrogenase (short-subunit alcohol dehydrogenase family)